jgi:hypothetical protein
MKLVDTDHSWAYNSDLTQQERTMTNSKTITFKSSKDVLPEHFEEIVYLVKRTSFDSYGFDLRDGTVEYCWFELDEDGEWTGNQACYTPGDTADEGWELRAMVDGYVIGDGKKDSDNILWMTNDEWFKSLGDEGYDSDRG